ncbi:nucleotide-diphospho-sugar transferase [Cercophora newfieldiana]|uniref:Nucleotide-diphospho-sugar transferase n=1 Tax=Cercophora newfieldiana TaxID=92897 RepID=A0AA40CIY1_9PEZI|nr:nucleotide-diphospho-sugar transferase [Cercophora newfieldiana]
MHSNTWIEMAPGYTYTLVGNLEAESFLAAHFSGRPEIAAAYHSLTNMGSKSDFLRYLLLYIRGGIYSDVDTKPIVRPDAWLPPQRRRDVRLLIAVEHDEPIDGQPEDFVYPVQFCQWTIAAAPHHPVFAKMIDRMLMGLRDVADRDRALRGSNKALTDFDSIFAHGDGAFTDFDVINTTGPVAWTEVVFGHLQGVDGSIKRHQDIWNMHEPAYYGDIAVLPLHGFRAERLDDWGLWRRKYALVRHFFKGSWKTSRA